MVTAIVSLGFVLVCCLGLWLLRALDKLSAWLDKKIDEQRENQ